MATSLDATFFAFRKREKGGVLLGASIGFAIGLAVLLAAFGAVLWVTIGPLLTELMSAAGKGDPSAYGTAPPTGILWIIPAEMLFLFAVFLLLAAYEAACYRWMIRGETGGVLGLSLNADTWRVYATYWVWFFFFIVAYLGVVLLAILIGGVGGVAGGESAAGGTILFIFLGVCAYLVAWLYVAVRLAPAAATSVGRGKFSFFNAWTVTSGRFWALFGAFLLLIIINIVVSLIVSTLAFSFLFAGAFANLDMTTVATDPNAFTQAYFAAIMRLFASPAAIAMFGLYQIVAGAIGLVFYVLFFGVNARAVQAALEEGKISPVAAA